MCELWLLENFAAGWKQLETELSGPMLGALRKSGE